MFNFSLRNVALMNRAPPVITPPVEPGEAPVLTFDGTTFTSNKPGQMVRSGTPFGATNVTSYAYNAATDLGHYMGIDNGELSNVIVVEAENPVTPINFNQADNTLLSAYPGTPFTIWGSEPEKWTVQGNKAHANRGEALAVRDTGSAEHFVSFEMTDGAASHSLIAYASGPDSFIRFEPQGVTDMWWGYYRYGGNWHDLPTNGILVAGSQSSGKKNGLSIKGGKIQAIIDGLPYRNGDGGFGSPAIQEDVWYDIPSDMPEGTYVGLRPWEGSTPSTSDNLRYGSLSKSINLYSAEIFGEDVDGVLTTYLEIIGNAEPNILNDAVVMVSNDDTGQLALGWTAATGAPGATGGDFTLRAIVDAAAVGGIEAQIYVSDATVRARTSSFLLHAQRPLAQPFRLGLNFGPPASWMPVQFENWDETARYNYTDQDTNMLNTDSDSSAPWYRAMVDANGMNRWTGVIPDAAWNWNYTGRSARGVEMVLRDGNAKAIYGTGGAWKGEIVGNPGDFEVTGYFQEGGAITDFVILPGGVGFTFTLVEGQVLKNFTVKVRPKLNGGKGVDQGEQGVKWDIRKVGSTSDTIFASQIIEAFDKELIVRGMGAQAGASVMEQGDTYPFIKGGNRWMQPKHFIKAVKELGVNAIPWETIFPPKTLRRFFEKLQIDLQQIKMMELLGFDISHYLVEIANEIWNWGNPYAIINAHLVTLCEETFNFGSGITGTGERAYYQKHAMAAWLLNAAGKYMNTGIAPDLTAQGLGNFTDLNQPELAMNGRYKTIFGIQGNDDGFMSVNTIRDFWSEIGDTSFINAVSPTHYWTPNNSFLAPLFADNAAGAWTVWLAAAEIAVNSYETKVKVWSKEMYAEWPDKFLIGYEGRQHFSYPHMTSKANGQKLVDFYVNVIRPSDEYKEFERRIVMADYNAGFWGDAQFTMVDEIQEPSGSGSDWLFANFGILRNTSAWADPAQRPAQKGHIVRRELQDLFAS